MKTILIIAAMADVELNYLKEKLENIVEEKTKICKFYIGQMFDKRVILCDAKVGLINTSAATTLAIEKYHPDYIINQGCAGGFGKDVHKSDIVIGTECINITSIMTKFREEGEGCNLEDWDLINYVAGEQDRLVPQKASSELIDVAKKIESKYEYGKIHYGVIGSGDIWNKECDRIIFLNNKYGMLCEDMEGIAVYTVANQYGIPAIDIRVISDNEVLKEDYERNISFKVQEFVEMLIESI
jgi:adenosylhomocysteine nucleosidase